MYIYLEGGNHLRNPMKAFLSRAVSVIHRQSVTLDVKPCGSGDDAIRECSRNSGTTLLIDSDDVVLSQLTNRVIGQIGATNHAFFMVRMMETWFLADRNALENYFGAGFRDRALPRNLNVEDIPKPDVENGLRSATRNCRKGPYRKGADDTRLLALLNPTAVYHACPNFARLIDFLRNNGGS